MAKPKPKRKRHATPRQQRVIIARASGKSLKEAAIEAGYSPRNAAQSAYQSLKRMQSNFGELLEEHGLTDAVLIEKYLKPLLKSKIKKHFAHLGKVRDTREYANDLIRRDALDMTFRLKGSYAPVATEETSLHAVTHIILDVPRPNRPVGAGASAIEVKPEPANGNGSNGHKANGHKP